MTFELAEREREALTHLIERRLPGLGVEIHRTESREFRQHLENEQQTLQGILGRLREAVGVS